jgi:signal transduction histidine kinase
MTIRVKFTLWYAGVLLASLMLSAFLLYQEWVIEPTQKHGAEAHDIDAIVDSLQDALWSTIPAAIFGIAGGWWLMRKTLTPIALLTRAGEQIKETNLKVRLPRSGNGDELDRLTGVFNSMTARLDESFNRIREFTLRASHELKTPLTIIRGELETALVEGMRNRSQHSVLAAYTAMNGFGGITRNYARWMSEMLSGAVR